MKIRTISATVYVAVLIIFYVLKLFVHALCFDALTYAFAVIGTFEMLRAVKDKTTKPQRVIVTVFSLLCVPAVAVAELYGYGVLVLSAITLAFVLAVLTLLVFDYENTHLENEGVALFSGIYPSVLVSFLVLVNHMQAPDALSAFAFNSNLFLPLIFAISPLSDVFAYLVGCSLKKKFPKKLAPKISPNKTVVGAIGAVIGGVIASGAVYAIYGAVAGSFENAVLWLPIFLALGFVGALFTMFGDLVESGIKRKLGIKDMGKIMPGHGGVLDRIDGTMFMAIAVYFIFQFIYVFF